jgi:hypothetical protein
MSISFDEAVLAAVGAIADLPPRKPHDPIPMEGLGEDSGLRKLGLVGPENPPQVYAIDGCEFERDHEEVAKWEEDVFLFYLPAMLLQILANPWSHLSQVVLNRDFRGGEGSITRQEGAAIDLVASTILARRLMHLEESGYYLWTNHFMPTQDDGCSCIADDEEWPDDPDDDSDESGTDGCEGCGKDSL